MIRIITLNVDDKVIDWYFESKEEIEKEWWNEECSLPSNDDPVIYVQIDDERIHIPNDMIFLNFLEMIGIDTSI